MPDITISLTAQQATRLQAAFVTPENPLPTIADAKLFLVRHLKAKVLQSERRAAESAITDTPFEPI